jgi:hypothetical protein
MMRLLTVALVFVLAIPALADAASRKKQPTRHPQAQHVAPAPQQAFAANPFALQSGVERHAGNPAHQVYRTNGEYAGADPDPRIRLMLRRDYNNDDP